MIDLMVLDDGATYVVYDEEGCRPERGDDGTPNRIFEVLIDVEAARVAIMFLFGSVREFDLPSSILSEVLGTTRAMATPVGGPLACASYRVGITFVNVPVAGVAAFQGA